MSANTDTIRSVSRLRKDGGRTSASAFFIFYPYSGKVYLILWLFPFILIGLHHFSDSGTISFIHLFLVIWSYYGR